MTCGSYHSTMATGQQFIVHVWYMYYNESEEGRKNEGREGEREGWRERRGRERER